VKGLTKNFAQVAFRCKLYGRIGMDQNKSICMPKFTPEEAVEIALLLWEYDRDGRIAIDNFIHREPQLSEKVAVNVIPKKLQRAYLAYLNRQKR
jgi:hypothetical protein